MSNFASFGAVTILKKTVLQTILRAYHNAKKLPGINGSTSFELFGKPFTLSYDFYFDLPDLILKKNIRNEVSAKITLIGPITAAYDGSSEQIDVLINATVSIKIEANVITIGSGADAAKAIQLVVSFKESDVDVGDYKLTKLSDGEMKSTTGTALYDDSVKQLFTDAIRKLDSKDFVISHAIVNELIGKTIPLYKKIGIKILDDAVAICADVDGKTSGNLSLVTDFSAGSTIAASVNPALWALAFASIRASLLKTYGDVTLNDISASLASDHIDISANATAYRITVDILAKAKLILTDSQIAIDIYDVDTKLPWWVWLIGVAITILSMGSLSVVGIVISALAIVAMSIITPIVNGIVQGAISKKLAMQRALVVPLPGMSFPILTLSLDALSVNSSGIDLWSTLSAQWNTTASDVRVEYPAWVRDFRTLHSEFVPHSNLFHPKDRSVRIRWEARDENSKIVAQQDRSIRAVDALRFPVIYNSSLVKGFTVYCRVYRALGDRTEELYYANRNVTSLGERVETSKKYVYWSHEVNITRTAKINSSGPTSQTIPIGGYAITRKSKIHRTDPLLRCRNVERYSMRIVRDPKAKLTYTDTLPFELDKIDSHRNDICDYCFYGGPDKHVPKHLIKSYALDSRVFEWKYYLDKYPELRTQGITTEGKAQEHWLNNGIKEGREASRLFSLKKYMDLHRDLFSKFKNDRIAYIRNFILHG